MMVVISKSGSTAETATNTKCFIEQLKKQNLNPDQHLVAITTQNSQLHKMSATWKAAFLMDNATGGRTSICSAVAMVPCAFAALDFAAFLKGMSEMDENTRLSDPKHNLAFILA